MYNDNCLMKTEYFKGECVMNIPSQCPYNMGAQWFRRGYGIHEKRAEGPGPALKNWELKLIDENYALAA